MPHVLQTSDTNMVVRLLNGDSENRLPVIYVSRSFHGHTACDPVALARQLGGLAHVIVEPSRDFSRSIQFETNSRNAYGGALGIYLPSGQSSIFIPNSSETDWEIRSSLVELVKQILINRFPQRGLLWADLEAERSRVNIDNLKSIGSTDLDAFIREFDAENGALKDKNEALSSEIAKLAAQIQKLNAISTSRTSDQSSAFKIQEYYDGEGAHFIRQTIESGIHQSVPGSRKYFLLSEFLEGISESEEVENRKKRLKSALSEAKPLDKKTEDLLKELGFTVETDGKHHKLKYFDDERLTFSMSKTPSDWRSGKNLASEISKKIY